MVAIPTVLGCITAERYSADIDRVAQEGWFVGKGNGIYDPDGVITASQISTVLSRVYGRDLTRAEFAAFLSGGYDRVASVKSAQSFFGEGPVSGVKVNLEGGTYRVNYRVVSKFPVGYFGARTLTIELLNVAGLDETRGINDWTVFINGSYIDFITSDDTTEEDRTIVYERNKITRGIEPGEYLLEVGTSDDRNLEDYTWEFTLTKM